MSCLMLASLVVRAVMRWVMVGGGFGVLFRGVGVWVSVPLWGTSRSWEKVVGRLTCVVFVCVWLIVGYVCGGVV